MLDKHGQVLEMTERRGDPRSPGTCSWCAETDGGTSQLRPSVVAVWKQGCRTPDEIGS